MARPTKVSDQQILDLLKQGKSYTDIQAELNISPSRISIVKKKHASEFSRDEVQLSIPDSAPEKVIDVIETALNLTERNRGVVFRNLGMLLSGDENELSRHRAAVMELRRMRNHR